MRHIAAGKSAGFAVVLVAALIGCARREASDAATTALARQLSGVWDVTMTLERSPLHPVATARAARGSFALLERARGERNRWLGHAATHTGVAELDLSALGIPRRTDARPPSLFASAVVPDSLIVVLPGDADDGVVLVRSRIAADSIRGTWSYESRSVGGWGGHVVLSRRVTTSP